ncbi:nardilysin-like isoform X3 [Diabrotica virgifera virgifera]|uniref:Nardilysin-like n=1 Tax=Diabrotica virgifera virgifera TaxID=50390 RepID=A0ABM5JL58_DIAVI|nr:nardilysin-like isoform X3 [Diabrotica virgifera virgifera]
MEDHIIEVLKTPIKSKSDKKEYKIIKLKNGLIAVLISDVQNQTDSNEINQVETAKEEKMAAATLQIRAGCLCDPVEILGLSHFLEHMVFMGSEKFPAENDFDSFIRKGGGSTNAYTDYEETAFYFECLEKHLPEALDKWSQFFIAPLLKEDALTREREAVDSEFQMALPNDEWRKWQLLMRTAKKGTCVQVSFPWGNLKTLKDNISDGELYKSVHEHRKRYYSSHNMTLAVQARLPLDTLEDYVKDFFSGIPNNNLPKPNFSEFVDVFDTPEFNRIYYIKPLNETIQLDLVWALPSHKYEYKSKPIKYLSHLLGDEGKGSILSYLKKHMWALALTSGCSCSEYDNNSLFSLFTLNVVLTEEGLKHVFDVIAVIFAYINLLKTEGPQEQVFEELKVIADTDFRFETQYSASYTTITLATNLHVYPPEDVISASKIYMEYREDKITEVVNKLTPKNVYIAITTKVLPDGLQFNKKEKWLQAEYTDIQISEELLSKWELVVPYTELSLPPPNPFLTSNFDLLPCISNQPEYPQKLIDTDKCELSYRQDQKFKLPTAHFHIYLINPVTIESPKNFALNDLFVELLSFAKCEEVYPATVASLRAHFTAEDRGITFQVNGFNEKLPLLLELMTKYVLNLSDHINQDIFNGVKEEALKQYYNRVFQTDSLEYELENKLLIRNYFSPLDTYRELYNLTFDDMLDFIQIFPKNLYVKSLVQGNVSADVACDTINKFIKSLDFEEIPKEKYPKLSVPQIPLGEKCLFVESFNKKDTNCITSNLFQLGLFSLQDMVLMDIIMRIIDEPCFNTLRTNEQLGYDVSTYGRREYGVLVYSLHVTSQVNKYSTEYLDSRIEAFLKQSQKLVDETTVEALEKIKEDLIKTKQVCDHNLSEEVYRNWLEIIYDDYMFDRAKQEVECIKTITLDDIKIWWNKHNHFGSQENFRKISFQIAGHIQVNQATCTEATVIDESGLKDTALKILGDNKNLPEGKSAGYFIEDIDEFKNSLCPFSKAEE